MVSTFIHEIKVKEWNALKLYFVKWIEEYSSYMGQ